MTNKEFLNKYHIEPYALEKCLTVLLEEYWQDSSRRLGRDIPPVISSVPFIRKFFKDECELDVELIEKVMNNRKDRDAVKSSCIDVDDYLEIDVEEEEE